MGNRWARQSIAALLSRANEADVQAVLAHQGAPLKRTLTAINLVALGIGAIIGADASRKKLPHLAEKEIGNDRV